MLSPSQATLIVLLTYNKKKKNKTKHSILSEFPIELFEIFCLLKFVFNIQSGNF